MTDRYAFQLTADELAGTMRTMRMYGGGFMYQLAEALNYADRGNTNRLLIAFPEIVERYGPGTVFYADTVIRQALK